MLRDTLFITSKDVKYMLRARETIFWVFLMPIVFFYFIGTVTGGFRGAPGDTKDKLALRADESAGFLLDQLTLRLEENDYEIVRPETDEAFVGHRRRLAVPAGFTDSVLAKTPVTLRFTRDESGLGNDYDTMRTGRAIYTVLADFIVIAETDGGRPTPQRFEQLNAMPRMLTIDVKPAGERKQIPTGFEQAVPGIMVMFTLLIMVTSGAILLVIERRQGLLRRLACTPISRLGVVMGKWGGKMALGMIQIAFAMLSGTVLFRMNWGPDLPVIILVMLVYGGVMASLGILLGSLARSEGQAAAIGVVSANVLAALGGCWWPIEITPPWMQKLQLFLPTGWAMDALHKLISFAAGPASVVPHVVGMAFATVVLVLISTKVFRFE